MVGARDGAPSPPCSPRLGAWSTSRGSTPAPATTARPALGDFSRTSKNDPRLVAYADVDEANSAIGVVLAAAGQELDAEVRDAAAARAERPLRRRRRPVHPAVAVARAPAAARHRASTSSDLEAACDTWNAPLEPLRSFILPGGTLAAAHLHVARTVTRRAERAVWAAVERVRDGRGRRREPADGAVPQPAERPAVHPRPAGEPGASATCCGPPAAAAPLPRPEARAAAPAAASRQRPSTRRVDPRSLARGHGR